VPLPLEGLEVPRSEVQDLDVAVGADAHVGRLEVEVEQTLPVSMGEPFAHLPPHVEDALDRPVGSGAGDLGEADAADELRRHPRDAFLLPRGEHARHVGVPEGSRGEGVPAQPPECVPRPRGRVHEALDRRADPPLRIDGVVHHAVRSLADLTAQLEGTQLSSRHEGSTRPFRERRF